ncbi:MAG: hypothetical protein ABI472_00280 [Ginsengibacter sp.]
MWIWWIASLISLIACAIFTYRMIVSSYEFLPSYKRYFWKFNRDVRRSETGLVQNDSLTILKNKVQFVEDNTTFYQVQFSKFQERLKALEEGRSVKVSAPEKNSLQETAASEEEDWKEMYYEENAAKEKLENDLDVTRQMLAQLENKFKESSEKSTPWVELQSNYEARLHDLQSQQNQIELLERQLMASAQREKELEQLLMSEIIIREKYSLVQREYIALQSEADDMTKRIVEISKRDANLEIRLIHLAEIESKLALCEEEKSKLKSGTSNQLME